MGVGTYFWIGIFVVVVANIIVAILRKQYAQEKFNKAAEDELIYEESLNIYNEQFELVSLPADIKIAEVASPNEKHQLYARFYVWKEKGTFRMFPVVKNRGDYDCYLIHWLNDYTYHPISLIEQYSIVDLDIERIDYYAPTGEKNQELVVSGGGSDMKGAIIGGVVAGGAGAIIGSRKEVTSHTATHDDRGITMYYLEKDGVENFIRFSTESYRILQAVLPEKDYVTVNRMRAEEVVNSDITIKLKQLESLKSNNLITENEYSKKKTDILSRL